MKYHEFLNTVVDRGAAADRDEAERVTRATLETLGERITQGEATDLAAQLPQDMSGWVTARASEATSYDLDEFCRRVSDRAGGLDQPERTAATVFSVLDESVTGGQIRHVADQLPNEYVSTLFTKV